MKTKEKNMLLTVIRKYLKRKLVKGQPKEAVAINKAIDDVFDKIVINYDFMHIIAILAIKLTSALPQGSNDIVWELICDALGSVDYPKWLITEGK